MILTENLMKKFNPSYNHYLVFKNNHLWNYDLNYLNEIKGDFFNVINWLKEKIKSPNQIPFINMSRAKRYLYDRQGNKRLFRDTDGYIKEWFYSNNKLKEIQINDETIETFIYDNEDNLIIHKHKYGTTSNFIYNKTNEYFFIIENDKEILRIPLQYIIN